MQPAPTSPIATGTRPADGSPVPELGAGLATTPMGEATPPALRVTGIGWFSGFRGSGLRIGDQIVAVDGEPLRRATSPDEARREAQRAIGSYGEGPRWAEAGKQEGAPLTLTVRRRATPGQGWRTLDLTGALRPARQVRSEDNRILLGPGGPPEMYENDGFDRGWRQWSDDFAKTATAVLDDPLHALALTSSFELRRLLEQQPRVRLLAQKYPGPFADAVQQDFDAMLERLQGPVIDLTESALDYRGLGEQRAADIRRQAQAAWAALQAELASRTLVPLFPAVHPVHGDRTAVVGRYAVLPPLRNRDWIGEAGHTWFVCGNARDGWYFADAEGAEAGWMLDALARYRRLVLPNIDESHELVGEVQEPPAQLVIGERAHFGLRLRPVAALVGGAMFVDLRQPEGGKLVRFAGEQALRAQPGAGLPGPQASPAEVMDAMVAALKAAALEVWISLFATWSVEALPDGRALFRANAVQQPVHWFEEARRRIMERVFDMRPVWVDDVRVLIPGDDYPGQQRLEEVTVEMQHIGRFGEGDDVHFRAFSDVTVNRWWRLQRLGPLGALGPWRITSLQPI
jgi:hypothetical protein